MPVTLVRQILGREGRHDVAGQFARYLIVGGCGYVLAMAVYGGQLAIGVAPYPAIVAAFVLNGVFNFVMFRRWAFPASGRAVHSEAPRFVVVALGSLAVNAGSFAVLYSLLGVPPFPAQALAIVIATPVGFVANRLWSFGQR
jgi:putative flippase GtrA